MAVMVLDDELDSPHIVRCLRCDERAVAVARSVDEGWIEVCPFHANAADVGEALPLPHVEIDGLAHEAA